MPPTLVKVAIPVRRSSPHRKRPPGRSYDDAPLPIRPSNLAPRNARILDRVAEPDKVAYTVEVGGVKIDDVGVDEVLDYVSPYDLEMFENQRFEEERKIIKIAMEIAASENEQRQEPQRKRAKTKGTVVFEEVDSETDQSDDLESELGRHGRARPTYKHLFQQSTASDAHLEQAKRRRRKRDHVTGELLPLSDDDEEEHASVSRSTSVSTRPPPGPALEIPKRRRRKRDPVTGILIPLAPVPQQAPPSDLYKRPRRRRHPVTRELMPLGWRYNPEDDKDSGQGAQDAAGTDIQSMHHLSISQEHESKRVKIISEPSSDDMRIQDQSVRVETNDSNGDAMSISPKVSGAEEDSSNTESGHHVNHNIIDAMFPASPRSMPKTSILSPIAQPARRPPPKSTSPEPVTLASFFRNDHAGADTDSSDDTSSEGYNVAMPNPATQLEVKHSELQGDIPRTSKDAHSLATETSRHDYVVEAILRHRYSHASKTPGRGGEIQYLVRWKGYKQPTWEPEESFAEKRLITAYRIRSGLDKQSTRQNDPSLVALSTKSPLAAKQQRPPQAPASAKKAEPEVIEIESDEDSGGEASDDGYEVEAILNHHLSDPRTHPGKPVVMLYQVKWVGYEELTWEPRVSFTDTKLVEAYERKVGL